MSAQVTCQTCKDTGHRLDAPWLLCPDACEAALRIRVRSGELLAQQATAPHR